MPPRRRPLRQSRNVTAHDAARRAIRREARTTAANRHARTPLGRHQTQQRYAANFLHRVGMRARRSARNYQTVYRAHHSRIPPNAWKHIGEYAQTWQRKEK